MITQEERKMLLERPERRGSDKLAEIRKIFNHEHTHISFMGDHTRALNAILDYLDHRNKDDAKTSRK